MQCQQKTGTNLRRLRKDIHHVGCVCFLSSWRPTLYIRSVLFPCQTALSFCAVYAMGAGRLVRSHMLCVSFQIFTTLHPGMQKQQAVVYLDIDKRTEVSHSCSLPLFAIKNLGTRNPTRGVTYDLREMCSYVMASQKNNFH